MVTGTISNQTGVLDTPAMLATPAMLDTPAKRGRKATPPDPEDGPVAAFARELWTLKHRAGDPSFATMCTRLGAAASKSSLAAATRGTALPSWETTWEFVRVLAVDLLGADEEDTRRAWLARWTAAGAAADPAGSADPPPGGPPPAAADPEPADPEPADATPADPAPTPTSTPAPVPAPTGAEPPRRTALFRPSRRQLLLACALLTVVAGLGSLATASPLAAPERAAATLVDDAIFEGDVTVPDGSAVAPGQEFTKVWQLRNTGSMRWEGRYLTRVNTTPCQAPNMVPIPATEPGDSVRIEVPVTAGESPAHCKIYWKMTDATQRLLFPDKNPIFLDVVVRGRS
ncbi:MAG: NBR1-Ig-like domain-containing protein [Pseudonocardiaceae bacterium]